MTPPSSRKSGLRRKIALYSAIALVLLVCAGVGGIAWYFSSQALDVAPDRASYKEQVIALRAHTVEFTRTTDTARAGTYNLQWLPLGRVTLGAVVSTKADGVIRRYSGSARGLKVGTLVHFDSLMYRSPADLHLSYHRIAVPDPLGPMPAWLVPGRSSTWVIIVHGRGANVTEA
jgi:hypothetical protein